MIAITFENEIKIEKNYPRPVPLEGEALIKVTMAGICNTDLEITKGYMGFKGVLGHEFTGTIEEVPGSGQEDLIGKRVVGEINCACNECSYCKKGLKTHCPNRSVLGIAGKDGCFAGYITLPLENLHQIPASISDEEATFVEPLAAAMEITEQVHIKSTDSIIVLGDGKLGLLIALTLNLTPAKVILTGKHPEKLAIAEKQGVQTILQDDLTISKEYDVVVDATGSSAGFEQALSLVKPRGTLVLKSTVADSKPLNLAPIVIDEITLLGSRCGPFKPAIRALKNKLVDVMPLVSKVFKAEAFEEALNTCKTGGVLKVLLDFRG